MICRMTEHALDRVIWQLRRAEIAVQAEKERRLRPLGLLASHYSVLISLGKNPGLTGAELARRLGVSPQNIAGLAVRLVEHGLIERRRHPTHRHVLEMHLTERGTTILAAADEVVADIEASVVATLGEADADQLRKLLTSLTDGLEKS